MIASAAEMKTFTNAINTKTFLVGRLTVH